MSTEEDILRSRKCDVKDTSPSSILEWVDFYQKNKPQINGISAGMMIIIYGGQNIGWGIFNDHLNVQPWSGGYEDDGAVFWTIISWFIANMLGLFIGSIVARKYSKIQIYITTSIFSTTSAICFIVHSTNLYAIVIARVIAGFSYGIVYVTILIHASELSIPKLRGHHVSIINFCTMIGVLLSSFNLSEVYKTRSYEHDPTKMLGYDGLICIISALIFALFLNRESPIYLIKKYKEKEALDILMRLRSELHETFSIRSEFNEFLLMIREDSKFSMSITNYCYQFIIVIFLKIIYVCSFNMPLNLYFLELAKIHFYDGEIDKTSIYLISARLVAMLISMFLIDFKRIQIFLVSSVGSGIFLLYLSIYPVKDDSFTSVIISIGFQISTGLALGNIADIYSVDSINTRIKPYFIWISSTIEILLQMTFIVSYFYFKMSIYILLNIFGILMAFGMLAFPIKSNFIILPNTSGLSLRVARNKFL